MIRVHVISFSTSDITATTTTTKRATQHHLQEGSAGTATAGQ